MDRANELVMAGKGDEKVKCTLYHGFRSKKSPENIKREGLQYYHRTGEEATKDAKEFLVKYGIEFHELDEWEREERWNIWASALPEAPCGWAERSPEVVGLTVEKHVWADYVFWEAPSKSSLESQWTWTYPELTDVERAERREIIRDYRKWQEEQYGKPMVAVLEMELPAYQFYLAPQNINTHRPFIPPDEIVAVFECPPVPHRIKDIKESWWTSDKWDEDVERQLKRIRGG